MGKSSHKTVKDVNQTNIHNETTTTNERHNKTDIEKTNEHQEAITEGDKVKGGIITAHDDLNAGRAVYKLMNLREIQMIDSKDGDQLYLI